MRPTVSVIMNAHESEAYLAEALDSVFAQTCPDFEIILWDNRSADRTVEIARSYADPRLRVLVAPARTTLAECRNQAIARAAGDWIAFLDCDDVWLPHKLEAQLNRVARASPATGMVYGRTLSFTDDGTETETIFRYEGRNLPEGALLRTLLLEGNVIPLVSAMVSRRAWADVGPIPARFTFAEDYWLFVAIAARYETVCVQEPCCKYRVHAGSLTATHKGASHREALEVLQTWGGALEPAELARRQRVYQTLVGVDDILSGRRVRSGVGRILRHGSLSFLARGSMAEAWRRLRGRHHQA